MIQEIIETKTLLFENIDKIGKFLARLAKQKTQITNIRNQTRDITEYPADINSIIKNTKNNTSDKFDILDGMDQFLKAYVL